MPAEFCSERNRRGELHPGRGSPAPVEIGVQGGSENPSSCSAIASRGRMPVARAPIHLHLSSSYARFLPETPLTVFSCSVHGYRSYHPCRISSAYSCESLPVIPFVLDHAITSAELRRSALLPSALSAGKVQGKGATYKSYNALDVGSFHHQRMNQHTLPRVRIISMVFKKILKSGQKSAEEI